MIELRDPEGPAAAPASVIDSAQKREDLVNLFHLLYATARTIDRMPAEVFSVMNRNEDAASYLMQLAHELNERWEVFPR